MVGLGFGPTQKTHREHLNHPDPTRLAFLFGAQPGVVESLLDDRNLESTCSAASQHDFCGRGGYRAKLNFKPRATPAEKANPTF
jgi:hypothetical protein